MKIKITQRGKIPECELYVEVIRQPVEETSALGITRPVMIMLPGGPGGNHTVYNEIKSTLLNYADLVLVDPRGCGFSSPGKAIHCNMNDSVEDIEALRQALHIEKFILFGGSYGAMVSLNYAITYPDSLLGLILVAGAPSFKCYETALDNLRKIGTEEQVALTQKLFAGEITTQEEHQRYYTIMRNVYLAEPLGSGGAALQSIPTADKEKPPYFLELNSYGHKHILPNYNIEDKLGLITVKTLLLAGEKDWINDVRYAHQMADKIPDARLVVFPDSGHFVWKGIEDAFFGEIEQYISGISNEPSYAKRF